MNDKKTRAMIPKLFVLGFLGMKPSIIRTPTAAAPSVSAKLTRQVSARRFAGALLPRSCHRNNEIRKSI